MDADIEGLCASCKQVEDSDIFRNEKARRCHRKPNIFACFLNIFPIDVSKVVNEHSARMGLPNELASSSTGSNHRTICRFGDSENQRYAPIGDAIEELVRLALSGEYQAG